MAYLTHFFLLSLSVLSLLASSSNVQPSPNFYARSCPNLQAIVGSTMRQALAGEARHRASALRLFFHDCFVSRCDAALAGEASHGASPSRLFFHDCFVSGCDAGILLEKKAYSNQSARCYEVIDTIKTNVEAACNFTLSCADILALAALEGVTQNEVYEDDDICCPHVCNTLSRFNSQQATVGAFTFPSSIAYLLRSIPLRHGGLGNLIKELTCIVEMQFVGSSPLVENSARTWTFIASKTHLQLYKGRDIRLSGLYDINIIPHIASCNSKVCLYDMGNMGCFICDEQRGSNSLKQQRFYCRQGLLHKCLILGT